MRTLLCGLVLAVAPVVLHAQAPAPAAPPSRDLAPGAALPTDPAVRKGKLPNGMTYYVRHNPRPEKRVALRLAIDVGSLLEDDDQRGLAHFLEHMAFNGSTNFEAGELVKFMESIGARFGADANAYTSFDETVYMLDVPTDREGLVERALLALSDFSGGIALRPTEIDSERGVVLEEWRLGQGAGMRVLKQQLPALYHGSRYADRLPIGQPEVLQGFTHARLREFYERWYHPELMAVVAVGDIDPAAMEAKIRESFATVRPRGPTPARPVFDVPPHEETLVSVATDAELTGTMVSVTWKRPKGAEKTVADYRRLLLENLLHQMMNDRLAEIARRADAPFLQAGSSGGELGRATESYSLMAGVAQGGAEAGIRALLVEARRARDHGFVAAELERARLRMLSFYDRIWRERDKSESSSFAREYVSNFLTGEAMPGIEFERRVAHDFLPTVTTAQLSALARELMPEKGRVVLATLPEAKDQPVPTEASLRATVLAAEKLLVTPWTDQLANRPLLKAPPVPGRVTSRREIPEIGATVLTLSNGVEVWLKPTDFKNDQVLFAAHALGGASLAPVEHTADARLAAAVIADAGLGGFTPVDLEKLLAGRIASATPYIHAFTHGVTGGASPADLETALQVAWLSFTAPNDDPAAFEVFRHRIGESVRQRRNEPSAVYRDMVQEVNTGGHPLYQPLDVEDIGKLDLAWARAYYRERFANAADFTFFFVGAFDPQAIVPLVERYVGSLPTKGPRATAFDASALRFPATVVERTVALGREPLSLSTLTFHSPAGRGVDDRFQARAAASVLRTLLRGMLREEKGQAYSASVGWGSQDPASDYGILTVSFGSSPANAPDMARSVIAEIQRLQQEGPPPEAVANEQEIQRRELEVARRQNGWWLGLLQGAHLIGADPREVANQLPRIDALTPASLREAFRRYAPVDRHTNIRLDPAPAVPAP